MRVIIVNHNTGPLLQNCIDALAAQRPAVKANTTVQTKSDGALRSNGAADSRQRFRLHLKAPRLMVIQNGPSTERR